MRSLGPSRTARALAGVLQGVLAEGDSERTTRTFFLARVAAAFFALLVAGVWVVRTASPITGEKAPAPLLDREANGVRFGVPEETRRAIFKEIAAAEPAARANGIAGFPGQPWSQEDHRCAFERDTIRGIAARGGLDITQVYLILDEGLRAHWPGPDSKPLTPRTTPLMPRRK